MALKAPYTPDEYLALDRAAPTRSEYYGGAIIARAGASEEHNIITVNVAMELLAQLKGGPCRPFSADLDLSEVYDGVSFGTKEVPPAQ